MQKKQENKYKLEGLEPRLLLSGDASAAMAAPSFDLEYIPVLVEKLQSDHLNQDLPLLGQNLADIFNPAEQLEDIFAGLTESSVDTSEKLVDTLDAMSNVDANMAEDSKDGFALDLRVGDVFEGVVPLTVGGQDTDSAEDGKLTLLGQARLTGDWSLDLRLVAHLDNGTAHFSVDPSLSSLRVNFAASDPTLDSGWYDGVAVGSIADLQLAGSFETNFRTIFGDGYIELSRLAGDQIRSLEAASSFVGHAALTLQLVETLNAPHGPPSVSLTWADFDAQAKTLVGQSVVSGSGLVEDGWSGDNATFLYTPFSNQPASFSSLGSLRGAYATPFAFTVASNTPSDLTLRLNGENVEVVDNLTGALLAQRAVGATSEIVIQGVNDLDDTLTVDFSNGLIAAPITFHGGDAGFDSLVFKGDGSTSVDYTAIGTDSANMQISGNRSFTTLAFTGLEPVTFSGLSSLTFNTNDSAIFADNTAPGTPGIDIITIDSPAAGQNRINGTSGGKVFENVTFFDIATVTLDLGLNDTAGNQDDQVTIDASGLVASGLQNFVINGGDGRDEVILKSGITLPVAGGALTFNGGEGDDYLVIHSGSSADITFDGGNGTDTVVNEVGTSGTYTGTDVETSIGLVSLVVNAFDDAAEWVADIKGQINDKLDAQLPLINKSLNELLGDPTNGLDFDLFGAFASALGTVTSAADLDALEEALEDALGLDDGGDPAFDNPELEITFVDAVLNLIFDFGLGANSTFNLAFEDAGLPMSGSVPLDLALAFDFGFGLQLDFGQLAVGATETSAVNGFLVALNDFQIQASLSSNDIDVNLSMDGVGSLAVTDGTANITALLGVDFDGGSAMTLAEIAAADPATLFALTPSGSINIVLPTSVSGGTAGIFEIAAAGSTSLVDADVFDSTDPELTLDVTSANIDVAGFLSLSGAFALRAQGQDFVGIGSSMTARMAAGSAVVELTAGKLGLLTGADTFAFEMQGGSVSIALDPLANITAADISVQYAGASTTVVAGTTISAGGQSFTFADGIDAGVATFGIQGFSAEVLGFVSLSGNVNFRQEGTDILAVGNAVTARMEATSSVYVELANAEFGFIAGLAGTAFELKNGALDIHLSDYFTVTGGSVLVQYSGLLSPVTGETTLSIGSINYTFDQAIASNTAAFAVFGLNANVADVFTLTGDIGFKRSGLISEIVAVGNDVTVRVEATSSVYVELANADFGLVSGIAGTAFELKNGAMDIHLSDYFTITGGSALVQFSGLISPVIGETTVSVGSISYTFDEAIAPNTVAFGVTGFNANVADVFTLTGDIGFKKSGLVPEIVAVGNDVTVRLEATSSVYVELANADFGLISGLAGTAFELKNGALDIHLSDYFVVTGGSVLVQFSGLTSPVTEETTVSVGTISYTFDEAIAANTVAFGVTGLNANVADVFTLSGAIGFKKSGLSPEIIAVGNDVSVRLEATSSVYVELANADFGLISGVNGTAFELKNGALDIHLSDYFVVTGGNVLVQFSGLTSPVDDVTTISVGTIEYTFDEAIAPNTIAFAVVGLNANVADVFTLTGDLGFKKAGISSEILAVGNDVTVRVEATSSIYVELANADFGLIAGVNGTAFELKNGAVDIHLSDYFVVTGGAVVVQFSGLTSPVTEATTISVGSIEYTFDEAIAPNTVAFGVVDFNANVADVFTLTGDIGFKKSGLASEIIAVGAGVTVRLEATSSVYVELANADFGLISGVNGTAFELKNGALDIHLSDYFVVTGGDVLVQFSGLVSPVDGETTISVGPIAYTFDEAIAPNTVAFAVVSLDADVADVFTLTGDIGFEKAGLASEIIAVGNDVTVRLEATSSVYVELAHADFGLISGVNGTAFELKNGALDIHLSDYFVVTGGDVLVQFSGLVSPVDGAKTISVGAIDYTFTEAIAPNTVTFAIVDLDANVADVFTLSGDIGFKKSGLASEILAVGNDVTVRLEATSSVYVELANADFGLISGVNGTAFELKNGALDIHLSDYFVVTGGSVLVQFSGLLSPVDGAETISVGSIDYTFTEAIAPNTITFAVVGLNANVADVFTLSGDIGFKKAGLVSEIIAVGNDVTVRMEATSSVYMELADADFGLISGVNGTAFELKNGALDIHLSDYFVITGGDVLVQFSGLLSPVDGTETISVGSIDYTFTEAIAPNTITFAIVDFNANVADVFTLSGDIGFKKSGLVSEIVAVGNDVTVRLEATSSVYVELANADFGLVSGINGTAFELKNGALDIHLSDYFVVTGGDVLVQFSGLLSPVTEETTISVGSIDYTFDEAIAPNTVTFAVVDLYANVADVFTLSGDLGFKKSGLVSEILAVGNDVTVRLEATSSIYVELAHADFGLVSGVTGTAFELKNGALDIHLSDYFVVTGGDVLVQFSGPLSPVDGTETISVGAIDYTFTEAIAPNTVAFAVVGLNANVADVFTLTGDLGFKKSGLVSEIIAVGNNVTVRMEATSSIYMELADADFGLISGVNGTAFELTNGDVDIHLSDYFVITGGDVFVQFSGPISPVNGAKTISVGSISYTFDNAIASNTIAFAVVDLNVNVADVFTLTGDIGFKKSGLAPEILAVGNDVTVRMAATDSVYVELANADFGLITGTGKFAFELKNGALDIQLGPVANVTAADVFVQFSGVSGVSAGTTISVGNVAYTFDEDIAPNTVAFAVVGFNADIASIFHLSGDMGFKKSGVVPEILAVGNDVTVRLEATSSVYAELAHADFGLIAGTGKFVFELKNGALALELGPVANVSADDVFVQFSSPNPLSAVSAGTTISVGSIDYTFDDDIAAGTVTFAVVGLSADVAGIFRLSGDIGFKKSGIVPEILAVGNDVSVSLEVNSSIYVKLLDADFGLIAGSGKFVFELKNGSLDVQLGPVADVSADDVFVQFSGPNPLSAVSAGTTISVGSIDYTFEEAIVANTVAFAVVGFDANIANVFQLSGDIGFSKSGTLADIVAVGNDLTVRLEATSSIYIELANADFGLIAGTGKFAFELKNGTVDIQLASLANVTADSIFVQFTDLTTEVTAGTTVSVGAVSYTFTNTIERNTAAFAFKGLSANLGGVISVSGDIGFSKSLTLIKAVGNNLTVRVAASASLYAEVRNASFGLIAGLDNGSEVFAVEVSEGTLDINMGPVAQLNVREIFVQFTGPTTTITAGDSIDIGPVSYEFGSDIDPATIALFVDGSLVIGPNASTGISLDGFLTFTVSTGGFNIEADVTLGIGLLGDAGARVNAGLRLSDAGLAAYLNLSASLIPDLGADVGLSFNASLALEINTTGTVQTFESRQINPGFRLEINGNIEFLGFAEASGYALITMGGSEYTFELAVTFELGPLDVDASGTAIISSSGVVLTTHVSVEADVLGIIGLKVSGDLEINTTSSSALGIPGNTFRLDLTGELDIAGNFKFDANFYMFVQDGEWKADISSSLDFFGIGSLNISGSMNSEGEFAFSVNGGVGIGVPGFGLFGSANFSLSYTDDNGTNLYGNGSYTVGMSGGASLRVELFGITLASAGFSIDYNSGSGVMSVEAGVTIDFGLFEISFSHRFSIGTFKITPPPPVNFGSVSNGQLTLNVGGLAGVRGVEEDNINEVYKIKVLDEPASTNGQTVLVSAFGRRQAFTNVTSIVGDFGDGTDGIEIDRDFAGPVTLNMGAGADVAMHYGSGVGTIDMGSGISEVRMPNASGSIVTGETADIISLGVGAVHVVAGTVDANSVGVDRISGIFGDVHLDYGAFNGGFNGSVTRTSANLTDNVANSLTLESATVDQWTLGRGDDNIAFSGLDDRTLDIVNKGSGSDALTFGLLKNTTLNLSDDGGANDTIEVDVNSAGNNLLLNRTKLVAGSGTANFETDYEGLTINDIGGTTQVVNNDNGGIVEMDDTDIAIYAYNVIMPEFHGGSLLVDAPSGIRMDGKVHTRNSGAITLDAAGSGGALNLYGNLIVGSNTSENGLGGSTIELYADGVIRLDDTDIRAAAADTTIVADGVSNLIDTTVAGLTIHLNGTGSTTDIDVRETDSIFSRGMTTSNGTIDIHLVASGSGLFVESGQLGTSGAGKHIHLLLGELDFKGGENSVYGTGELTIHAVDSVWTYLLGSAGETAAGEDLNGGQDPSAMELSMRDVAALRDGFSKVTIGRTNAGNVMKVGDLYHSLIVKATNQARNVNATLKDEFLFLTDDLEIFGDIEGPNDLLTFMANTVRVFAVNHNLPDGAPDSGVFAKHVVFAVHERLTTGGWMIGRDAVTVQVLGTQAETSLITDLSARIESQNANSAITINTSKAIKHAGTITVGGTGSTLDLDGATLVNILEGGIVQGSDANLLMDLTAGEIFQIDPGSGIVAGAVFDNSSGTPVAVLTGANSSVVINSPSELLIGGSVTTSGEMTLNAGTSLLDHSDVFNAIAALDPEHYLIGHSTYSVLLTGTLTTLGADSELRLSVEDDIIIRGNINVLGDRSDLLLQSEAWVYIEGFLKVTDSIRVLGGIAADGTDLGGADARGSSVYVHETAQMTTSDADSVIDIRGSQDVDLFGAIIAGGEASETGVAYTGNDASLMVAAGQQLYIDTGLLASLKVSVSGGVAGPGDVNLAGEPLGLVVTTAGGLSAGGLSSTGQSGLVEIVGNGDIEMMGTIISGGRLVQTFDTNGILLSQEVAWLTPTSDVRIDVLGRAFVGGLTENINGEVVETGGYIRASREVEVVGGHHDSGTAVLVSPVSEVTTNNADGVIIFRSGQDAEVNGLVVPGGRVDTINDATGRFLGRVAVAFDGDSELRIEAAHQIRIGLEMQAGKTIDLIGGVDPVEPDPADGSLNLSGRGIVIIGSGRLVTHRADSAINLNAPGRVDILPPGHTQEIQAQGFMATADGVLANDVVLNVFVDKVDFDIEGLVRIFATDTADNNNVSDLLEDIQTAIENAVYTVTRSDNPNVLVGSTYNDIADDPSTSQTDPDLQMKLRNGHFLFTSPYKFQIRTGSSNEALVGLDLSGGTLSSGLLRAIEASQLGSVVSIGAPAGPNGKLYIAGKVLAHDEIKLYSGTSPDGVDIDLEATGVLETVNGSIAFNAGVHGEIKGDVLARGAGSDVALGSAQSLVLRGLIEADDDITVSSGQNVVAGQDSVVVEATSQLRSLGGGGTISITGLNDVVINGLVGNGSTNLSALNIEAINGELLITRESGRIESDAPIYLRGAQVNVSGVLFGTEITPTSGDYELRIEASDRVTISGDVQTSGSVSIGAGNLVSIYDTTLLIGAGHQLNISSLGDVAFGQLDESGAIPVQRGAVVKAPAGITIGALGTVDVSAGTGLFVSEESAPVAISGGEIYLVGAIYGGAELNASQEAVWMGRASDVSVTATDLIKLGGDGVDVSGAPIAVGGSIQATGDVTFNVSNGAVIVSEQSLIRSDATGNGQFASLGATTIDIDATDSIQVHGLIEALDDGADIDLSADGLVRVNGLVYADDAIALNGGDSSSNVSVYVTEFVFLTNGNDILVDENGRLIDDLGFLIDSAGNFVDESGAPSAFGIAGGAPVRLSGGTVTTGPGGSIAITGSEAMLLHGVMGQTRSVNGTLVADVNTFTATTAGNVFVAGAVDVANTARVSGADVTLMDGGRMKVRGNAGQAQVLATGTLTVIGGGSVEASNLLHLSGNDVQVLGALVGTGDQGRVLLNAVSNATVTGSVVGLGDVEGRVGVGANWSEAQLLGPVAVGNLNGGSLNINGAGRLSADGDIRLKTGNAINVLASAVLGDGQVPERTPLISNDPKIIEVVTGSRVISDGFILVPEVTWVETQVIEQVGVETVKIGTEFNTMDVTLTQDGYSNGTTKREYFINGVDYRNSSSSQGSGAIINWSNLPDGETAPAASATFNQLSDIQRTRVIESLGYKRLFNFSYANPQEHRVINGQPSVSTWTPDWAGNGLVTVNLTHVDVLADKWVRLPSGALNDLLRMVSQGLPTKTNETVGTSWNTADVFYDQIKSRYEPQFINGAWTDDFDDSPGRWQVSYINNTGIKHFDLTDGFGGTYAEIPVWNGQSLSNGSDALGRLIYSAGGYRSDTAALANETGAGSHIETVGRNYRDHWSTSAYAPSVGFYGSFGIDLPFLGNIAFSFSRGAGNHGSMPIESGSASGDGWTTEWNFSNR